MHTFLTFYIDEIFVCDFGAEFIIAPLAGVLSVNHDFPLTTLLEMTSFPCLSKFDGA